MRLNVSFTRATLVTLAAAALAACGSGGEHEPERAAANATSRLTIEQAWVRAPLGGRDVTAAYVTIANMGTGDRLVSASSPIGQSVELHTHERDGDVMRMRQVDGFDVPAGDRLEMAPGGAHLMVFGLSAPLQPGEIAPLTLVFEQAGVVEASALVSEGPPAPVLADPDHGHAHDDGGQGEGGHEH